MLAERAARPTDLQQGKPELPTKQALVNGGRGPGRARWLETLLDKLPAMAMNELRALWASSQNSEPPGLPEHLLRRLIAQRLQEHRYGGLAPKVLRELERVARREPAASARASRDPALRPAALPGPGTRLIREWNGRTIAVQVWDDGYIWEGRNYRSLSAIACEVTGAKWSGPRFFGLRGKEGGAAVDGARGASTRNG